MWSFLIMFDTVVHSGMYACNCVKCPCNRFVWNVTLISTFLITIIIIIGCSVVYMQACWPATYHVTSISWSDMLKSCRFGHPSSDRHSVGVKPRVCGGCWVFSENVGSRPSDHYFHSVCLSVCLCRVFLSHLWSDFDQTRTLCYMSGSSCVCPL